MSRAGEDILFKCLAPGTEPFAGRFPGDRRRGQSRFTGRDDETVFERIPAALHVGIRRGFVVVRHVVADERRDRGRTGGPCDKKNKGVPQWPK